MRKLEGSVAIVAGGARGMGASHVRGLIAEGASVIIGDVLKDEGRALEAELGAAARFIELDVTRIENWRDAVQLAEATFGPINILVNNAALIIWKGIEDSTPEEFRRVVDVNLTGVFNGMHAAAPSMRKAGWGAIINISSTAGMMGYPYEAGYVASKWGVRGLTKAAALEFAEDNIRVFSLHPGAIRSPMAAHVTQDTFKHMPIKRIGEPEEVTKLVIYLAADATYATGAEFMVDGGQLLMGPGPTKRRNADGSKL